MPESIESAAPEEGPPAALRPPPPRTVSFASLPIVRRKDVLRRSLRAATFEGIFAEVFNSCTGGSAALNAWAGGAVLVAWALHLGAGPITIGLLGSLPFVALLVHLPAAWVTSSMGRRTVCIRAVAASRQAFLPLALLPWVPLARETKIGVLLAVVIASSVLSVIGNNAWVSWMGDLVPKPVRGRYFGRRTAVCTLGQLTSSLAVGFAMDQARAHAVMPYVLTGLALAACLIGAVTTWFMSQQHEPRASRPRSDVKLSDLLQPFRDPNMRSILAFQMAWNASVGIAAPFFTVHMLQNLKMSFVLIALQAAATSLMRTLTASFWGQAIDRVGARPVLTACSFSIGLIPLIWLFPTPSVLWPLAIDSVLSGTLWAGQSLAVFALPLAVAPERTRPFYLAAFNASAGLSFALASAVGGLIVSLLPREVLLGGHLSYGIQALFLISSVARFASARLTLKIVEGGSRDVDQLLLMFRSWATQFGWKVARLPLALFGRL